MTEQAQLFLLKDRLMKIRKDKRNATILSLAISFMAAVIIQQYWNGFILGFAAWFAIGILFALTVIRYYNTQEAQVLWQIEQLARESSPDNMLQIMVSLAKKRGGIARVTSPVLGNRFKCEKLK